MRIVRFQDGDLGYWGTIEDGMVVYMPDAPYWGEGLREVVGPVDQVRLLAPATPSKIVAVGLNYEAHVTERDPNRKVPTEPVLFMKPPSALVGHGDTIRIAHPDHQTHHEAELVVVIGKRAKDVPAPEALAYVLGLTCGNDVSDRDLQAQDGQFVRAKGFDTYAPMGPWLQTNLDPSNLTISATVNGEVRQQSNTNQMLWGVPELISFISSVMTLEFGDVIYTGTPAGVGPIKPGDEVSIVIEGIGMLTNPVGNPGDDHSIPLGPKHPGSG